MEQDLQKLSEEMSENYSEDILNRYARMQQAFEEAGGYTYHSDMMTIFYKIWI